MTVQRWEQDTLSAPGRDVVDGWAHQVAAVSKLAGAIAQTPFVGAGFRGSDAAVTAAILFGREIGVGPMMALQGIYVVNGSVAMRAQLMRALVLRRGHSLVVRDWSSASCTLVGRRVGDAEDTAVTWTTEDARRARLSGPAWSGYPRAMLLARATGELCRAVFPDVIGGMTLTVEEAEDIGPDSAPATPDPAPTRTVRRRKDTSHPSAARASSSTDADPGEKGGGPDPADLAPPPAAAPPSSTAGGELPPLPDDAPAATDEARQAQNSPQSAEQPTPAQPPPDEGHKPLTPAQRGMVFELLGRVGASIPRAKRLNVVSGLVGRRLSSLSQLTRREASALIDTLVLAADSLDPAALDALVASGWERINGTEVDAPTVGAGDIDRDQMALWDDDDEEGSDHDDGR
jgi:hypothetical protein